VSIDLIQPAVGYVGLTVPTGVGLDVQNRGAVDHIHPFDMKDVAFNGKKTDDCKCYRVDPVRRAGSEKPQGGGIASRKGQNCNS
jgi:hypothetical protein